MPDGPSGSAGPRGPAALARDVERVADRLRGLSEARLAQPVAGHPSRAAAALAVAQLLAEAAQGLEQRSEPEEPSWRSVPALGDLSAGDQLAVTGHDLVAASRAVEPGAAVWARGRRRTAAAVLDEAAGRLAELRLAL